VRDFNQEALPRLPERRASTVRLGASFLARQQSSRVRAQLAPSEIGETAACRRRKTLQPHSEAIERCPVLRVGQAARLRVLSECFFDLHRYSRNSFR
jgi:hypothetical protein